MSEQPRTRAGQSLLRQWSGHVNEPEVRIVVLAIEAEAWDRGVDAGAQAYADDYAARATAAVPADAWQAGYEACWNRLKDAGRLLPSDAAAVPLDVERLALTLRARYRKPNTGYSDNYFLPDAEAIAAEYARLSADEEEGGTT